MHGTCAEGFLALNGSSHIDVFQMHFAMPKVEAGPLRARQDAERRMEGELVVGERGRHERIDGMAKPVALFEIVCAGRRIKAIGQGRGDGDVLRDDAAEDRHAHRRFGES